MNTHHRVALVQPSAASLAWLARTVKELQADDPLQSVTVVAPNPDLADVVRQHLAAVGSAGVQCTVQLRPLAERIGRACGSRAFDHPLTGPLESAAIRVAVHDSGGDVLKALADNRMLHESLGALFRELGHLDLDDPTLDRVVSSGRIGAAAGRTYGTFSAVTRDFPDVPRQLRIAAQFASQPPTQPAWCNALGPVVVYLPDRIDSAEKQFLAALAQHVPLQAVLAWFDDAETERAVRETANALAKVLGVPIDEPERAQRWPSVPVLSAPDPEEETRSVVRQLLSDMEAGVPHVTRRAGSWSRSRALTVCRPSTHPISTSSSDRSGYGSSASTPHTTACSVPRPR